MVTSHFQTITGLQPTTTYYYRARSRDAALNLGTAADWFTTTSSNQPPTVISVTPSSGIGATQVFRAVYSDANGSADITKAYILVNTSQATASACYAHYDRATNSFYLRDNTDTQWLGLGVPGSNSALQNSQCVLRAPLSSKSDNGNNLTVNFALDFKSAFQGTKNVYLSATDSAMQSSGWPQGGTFTAESVQLNPPSFLEANLAHMKFDVYDYDHTGHIPPQPPDNYLGYVPGCPLGVSIRQCYKDALTSYAQQGVNGVRFFFSICGLENSTALVAPPGTNNDCWSADPTQVVLSQTWVNKVNDFLQDVKDAGLTRITINPLLSGGERVMSVSDPCTGGTQELVFSPVAPYGFDKGEDFNPAAPWGHGAPYGGPNPRVSYNCSPANPVFVGWDKIRQVIEAVLEGARTRNFQVTELELQGEINLELLPVWARCIFDNKHGDVNVFEMFQNLMVAKGFEAGAVAIAAAEVRHDSLNPQFYCDSAYGDSARLMHLSQITAAIGGALFGEPFGYSYTSGLTCGGSFDELLSPRLPGYFTQPKIVDVHSYPCRAKNATTAPLDLNCRDDENASDIQSYALTTFNHIKAFIDSFGPPGWPGAWRGYNENLFNAVVAIGETHPNDRYPTGKTCTDDNAPGDASLGAVKGFNQSGLAGRTVPGGTGIGIRPWGLPVHEKACYAFPQVFDPPYKH